MRWYIILVLLALWASMACAQKNQRPKTKAVSCLGTPDPAMSAPQLNGTSTRRRRNAGGSSTGAAKGTATVSTVILNARTNASFRERRLNDTFTDRRRPTLRSSTEVTDE
ncbi:uncharacterized protein LOC100904772 [Galendromus occidentalis]|uniref:Uncharacterized protein LOC100904772 n=1 Tax=Galendromus occidentalis TaxID=34638 RepID=A0AAJ6VZU1_9ACAR|nr:uncharacterized protein LOC100904772 [Galendromus occidentalis]